MPGVVGSVLVEIVILEISLATGVLPPFVWVWIPHIVNHGVDFF